jgi:PAS domain S-box-containing protein
MRTDSEIKYLLKSMDVSDRKYFIVSTEFVVLAANRFTMETHGKDIIGKLCHEVIYKSSHPCRNCPAVIVLKTGEPSLRPIQEEQKSPKWSSCRYSYPIKNANKVEALTLLDFHQSAREEIEVELERSNSFLRNLILSSVDSVVASDMTGKIIAFNEAAAEITGYSQKEALEQLDIRNFYPEDGARDVMKKLRSDEFGGKGKLKLYQTDILKKNSETVPISLNAAVIYEGDKEVASIGFFHDLRDELRMQSELENTRVQLLQAEKMAALGKLSAGVAHQLNNPIGGITLFAKLILEEYELEEGAKEDMFRILKEAQRCKDTVKELLEFSRQTGHLIKPNNLNKALSRTLFLLENQSLFQNINITKDLSEELPDVPVDMQQMNHVFMNIILNAAQAMDGCGELTIKTALDKDRRKACIKISDTGPGIPSENISNVFEPFFTTKEEGEGTGLGLSIVYGIIQNHSGNITVESASGKGAVFNIELPLDRVVDEKENKGEDCE